MGCGGSKEEAKVSASNPGDTAAAAKTTDEPAASPPKKRERKNSYVAMETRDGAMKDSPIPPEKAGIHSNHGSKPDYRTGVPRIQ